MVYYMIFILLFFASVGFMARLVASLFSEESARRMREHKRFHVGWFTVVPIFAVMWVMETTLIGFSPPVWWERRTQRAEVQTRVQAAGGWDVLRKDCMALSKLHKDEPICYWHMGETNGLPASVMALKPRYVESYSAEASRSGSDSGMPFIKMKIFGAHSSGGHDQPFMFLIVVCGNAVQDSPPHYTNKWEYRKVVDGVFETYR